MIRISEGVRMERGVSSRWILTGCVVEGQFEVRRGPRTDLGEGERPSEGGKGPKSGAKRCSGLRRRRPPNWRKDESEVARHNMFPRAARSSGLLG